MLTVLAMLTFAACSEKDNDDNHNSLFQTSWGEGRSVEMGESVIDGYDYSWSRTACFYLDFLDDSTVRVYGSTHVYTVYYDNNYQRFDWDYTLRYTFVGQEGMIYGRNGELWSGEETPIRLVDDSLQIQTKNGLVSLGKKRPEMTVSNVSYTDCKDYPYMPDPDSINVSYANNTIFITHYNVSVNCQFKQNGVLVEIEDGGSTITIYENANPFGAATWTNCWCVIDNSFQINNVPHGTYKLVFENWTPGGPYSQTFTF